MKKIISFLGMCSNYRETTYRDPAGGPGCRTLFFQEALVQFYRPEALYVLLTPGAEACRPRPDEKFPVPPQDEGKTGWALLQDRLAGRVDLRPVRLASNSHDAADLWRIFEAITSCIEDGDDVVFDITYGFRSLPVVALVAISYLRVVRQFTLQGLVYGAFDASTEAGTPVFDLTPMLGLLDWTTATDKFLQSGDARDIQKRMQAAASDAPELAAPLETAAASMKSVSRALALTRPREALPAAEKLVTDLAEAEAAVAEAAKPFYLLLERTRRDYQALACADAEKASAAALAAQWRMLQWYVRRRRMVQAVTLAREWMVSLVLLQCEGAGANWMTKSRREQAENWLNHCASSLDAARLTAEDRRHLHAAWKHLSGIRNNIAHCGMQGAQRPAQEMYALVRDLPTTMGECARWFGLDGGGTPPPAGARGRVCLGKRLLTHVSGLGQTEVKGRIHTYGVQFLSLAPNDPERVPVARALRAKMEEASLLTDDRWSCRDWVRALRALTDPAGDEQRT